MEENKGVLATSKRVVASVDYDALVLSGAIVLHHVGKAASLTDAADQIRVVLDSGLAAKKVR